MARYFASYSKGALPVRCHSDRLAPQRDLANGIIAFVVEPTREYFLWRWQDLYDAWQASKDDWKLRFGGDNSPRNSGRASLCCFVPVDFLCGVVKPVAARRLSMEEREQYERAVMKKLRDKFREFFGR